MPGAACVAAGQEPQLRHGFTLPQSSSVLCVPFLLPSQLWALLTQAVLLESLLCKGTMPVLWQPRTALPIPLRWWLLAVHGSAGGDGENQFSELELGGSFVQEGIRLGTRLVCGELWLDL